LVDHDFIRPHCVTARAHLEQWLDLGVGSRVTVAEVSRLTVSKLARQVGSSADTVRYYERLGLLSQADRTPSGYRLFDEGDIERMRFIQAAQRLGLTLAEIRELLDIGEHGLCPCGHARELLAAKLPEIENQLEALAWMRDAIRGQLDADAATGRWPLLFLPAAPAPDHPHRPEMKMPEDTPCSCGCGALQTVSDAAACRCGCKCCPAASTREEEIAELLRLRDSVEQRLAQLGAGS
jgi:DNA-binding transcriptional MerR regulator